jgi:hypothetical protein
VIADLETRVPPLPEDLGARIALAVHIQLPLVHEQDNRNLFGLEAPDQPGADLSKPARGRPRLPPPGRRRS